MRNGITICELFSNPRPFAYGDPHMHTAIPIFETITHMGIQDLISHVKIFPVCIRLVTEKSPYAYRDAQIPVCIWGLVSMQSPYAYGALRDTHLHTGIKINPRMHMGITCLAPHLHTGIFMRSPYAYRDLCDPHMHTEIDLDPRMHTGTACCVIPVCIQGFA